MTKREWTKSTKDGWTIYDSGPYSIQRDFGSKCCGWFYEGNGTVEESIEAAKAAIEQHAKDNQ